MLLSYGIRVGFQIMRGISLQWEFRVASMERILGRQILKIVGPFGEIKGNIGPRG